MCAFLGQKNNRLHFFLHALIVSNEQASFLVTLEKKPWQQRGTNKIAKAPVHTLATAQLGVVPFKVQLKLTPSSTLRRNTYAQFEGGCQTHCPSS